MPLQDSLRPEIIDPTPWSLWIQLGAIAALLFVALVTVVLLTSPRLAGRMPLLRQLSGSSLRSNLLVGLTLMAVLPSLSLGLILTQRTADQRAQRLAARLGEHTQVMAVQIGELIEERRAAVESLADSIALAGHSAPQDLTRWLVLQHRRYPRFLTMLVADGEGRVIAGSEMLAGEVSVMTDLGERTITDRKYFREPMRTGAPYVSPSLRRGPGNAAIVAISAPLPGPDGAAAGVIEASLDPQIFASLRSERPSLQSAELVMVDALGRIVYASPGSRYRVLDPLVDPSLGGADVSPRLVEDEPGDARSRYIVAGGRASNGWRVWLRYPLAEINAQVWRDYQVMLLWLSAAMLVAALLAMLAMRRVTLPLRSLIAEFDGFDPSSTGDLSKVPPALPAEFRRLFRHLRSFGVRLVASYRKLRAALAESERLRGELESVVADRDREVDRRTAQLAQANETLQRLTRVDSLTGIANRRWFAEFLEQAWRVGVREQIPLSIIILDVDHFKAYNDSYGHQAGDECLQRIAAAIGDTVGRPLDLVARYGGEEFAMVLADTSAAMAERVAERARRAVAALGIRHESAPLGYVTISLGVATIVPRQDQQASSFVMLADQALYRAKREGRNQVARAA